MFHAFLLDLARTIQAVAFLLRREPHRCMNYMRLLKVLYLAERKILADSGKPLTGSPVVAMKRGPVLEDVYSLIRSQHVATAEWAKHFRTVSYRLEMHDDPGSSQLSRFVTRTLEEVAAKFDNCDEFDMVDFTHTLPEWQSNDPGESSRRISLEDILRAVGREQDLDKIVSGAKADHDAAKFFATSEP